jgi:hypothetical protein
MNLQLNQLPKPQRLELLTNDYTMLQTMRYTTIQDIQRYKIYKRERFHTLGPSMPQVAFTPLGLPSLAIYPLKHLRIKQVVPPQVGYSATYQSTPQQ